MHFLLSPVIFELWLLFDERGDSECFFTVPINPRAETDQ